MDRAIHLAAPIWHEPAHTAGFVVDAPTPSTDTWSSWSMIVVDFRRRDPSEAVAWRPVCGAPPVPRMARRNVDKVTCGNCLRTRAYREWVEADRRDPNERAA